MDNYKIINTHTNEIIKALNDLGYVWTPKKFDEQDCLLKAHWILTEQSGAITYSSGTMIDYPLDFQELTLPQLRDLVVLKRNDVKDATHVHGQDSSMPFYVSSSNEIYLFYPGKTDHWTTSKFPIDCLKPIHNQEPEQGLISGADALRALADGKEIQWVSADFKNWNDLDIWNANLKTFLNEKYIAEGEFKFRLKPRTIKLELEIPAPFEPKVGEVFFVLYPTAVGGYSKMHITDQKRMDDYAKLGAWRTEEEIKQVVAALRGIKG